MCVDMCFQTCLCVWVRYTGVTAHQPVSTCVPLVCRTSGLCPGASIFWEVSLCLDTHVFPIQARLAILARLSLWEEIIGQKSGLG